MGHPAAYILCTAPRSGSTLLCRMLAATGVAGRPNSYFHQPSLADWRKGLDLPLPGPRHDRANLTEIMHAARRAGEVGTGLFAVRVQRHSFEFLARQLAILHPGHKRVFDRFEAAFGPTRLVHLSRPDKLAQAVSYVRAMQGGLWHRHRDGQELERLAPPRAPVYDRPAIAAALADMSAQDAAWEAWFARESLTPLRLSYDDLSAHPEKTVADVLGFLGRDPSKAAGVAPDTARLADQLSSDWAARFQAEASERR